MTATSETTPGWPGIGVLKACSRNGKAVGMGCAESAASAGAS